MSTRATPRLGPSPAAGPTGPSRGASRLLRGWAAAFVATLLAAGSHTVANLVDSGASHAAHSAGPAPILWILTLALAGPVCTALAGRTLSWWRLSAGVTASQLLFHWLYSATADPAAACTLTDLHGGHGVPGTHAGHLEGLVNAGTGSESGAVSSYVPGVEATLPEDSPAMAVAHLLAAVVTVLVLRRGEVLAARVAELAGELIVRSPGAQLSRWVPAVPVRRVSAAHTAPECRPEDVLLPSRRQRGPPETSQLALAA